MRYIRTAHGIFEHNEKDKLDGVVINDKRHIACHGDRLVSEDEVIRRPADTIPELCDAFVVMTDDGRKYTYHSYEGYVLFMMECKEEGIGVEAYGAIWTTGEKGEPILKSIAKRYTEEGKEDLKLL